MALWPELTGQSQKSVNSPTEWQLQGYYLQMSGQYFNYASHLIHLKLYSQVHFFTFLAALYATFRCQQVS